jgi:hypothetical protein
LASALGWILPALRAGFDRRAACLWRRGGLRCRVINFYEAMEDCITPQNLPCGRRTFRQATEPSVASQNLPSRLGNLPSRRGTFCHSAEPSVRPQNLPSGHRTFRQATELSVRPQNLPSCPRNLPPRHRTFRHATEPFATPQNLPPRRRTFRCATEPSAAPQNLGGGMPASLRDLGYWVALQKPGVEHPWLYARVPSGLASDLSYRTRGQGAAFQAHCTRTSRSSRRATGRS